MANDEPTTSAACKYGQSHHGWPPGTVSECVWCERERLAAENAELRSAVEWQKLAIAERDKKLVAANAGLSVLHDDVVTEEMEHAQTREKLAIAERDQKLAAITGRVRARQQPCGCVVCHCDGQERCHGCGAKSCGTDDCVFSDPLGKRVVYETEPSYEELSEKLAAAEAAMQWRAEVVMLACAMEARLRANEYKGGWKEMRAGWLLNLLRVEVEELCEALDTRGPAEVWHEAADVANFAMMIADVFERGFLPPAPGGER